MSDFNVSASFKVDVAGADGTFDGVLETLDYDATQKAWRVTDGATGTDRIVKEDASRKGWTPVSQFTIDADQDGAADPFVLSTDGQGRYGLVIASQRQAVEGADINGDGVADVMASITTPSDHIKGNLVRQTGASAAMSSAVLVSGDADARALLKGRSVTLGAPHWGIDMSARDPNTAWGHDFYAAANGTFLTSYPLPPNRTDTGAFTHLFEQNQARIQNIILDAGEGKLQSQDAQKISHYYTSYVDTDAIDAKGLAPFQGDLAAVQDFSTHSDLARLFSRAELYGFSEPLGLGWGRDVKDPNKKVIYLGMGGLGMGDRDNYLGEGDRYNAIRAGYKTYITTLLTEAGIPNAEVEAGKIMALETELAHLHYDDARYRNTAEVYNPMSLAQVKKKAPEFDWDALLEGSELPAQDKYIVSEKESLAGAARVISSTPISTWKSYMAFQYLNANAGIMPKQFRDARFDFFGRTMYGMQQPSERWRSAVNATSGALGEAVGKEYVTQYFPPEAKTEVEGMVDNLMTVYKTRLEGDPNLSPKTRRKALEKLAAYKVKMGYPDKWDDFSKLDIQPGDAYGNAQRLRAFRREKGLEEFSKPVDPTDWPYPPQTVNASYSPINVDITFPAGILQWPFFDLYSDDAVNYGAIGGIIGHEISHGFDDRGSTFNAKGQLDNWWTKKDRQSFDARTAKLAQLASDYTGYDVVRDADGVYAPVADLKMDGELSLGENTADLVGLSAALDAYHKHLADNGRAAEATTPDPAKGGLTGDQRFFLGWAQAYKGMMREGALRQQLAGDPHAPEEFRVNGVVPQMQEWYDAFGIKPGDPMYIDPKDRITIWGQ